MNVPTPFPIWSFVTIHLLFCLRPKSSGWKNFHANFTKTIYPTNPIYPTIYPTWRYFTNLKSWNQLSIHNETKMARFYSTMNGELWIICIKILESSRALEVRLTPVTDVLEFLAQNQKNICMHHSFFHPLLFAEGKKVKGWLGLMCLGEWGIG